MNKDLLKITNLSKEFLTANSKIKILKKINVKIAYGKIVALVGPSGSGKSTLLHLIGQLDTVTSGDIFFENVNLSNVDEQERDNIRRDKISIVYQQNNLLYDFNVLENVIMPLLNKGIDKRTAEQKALKILKSVKMSHRMSHFPDQLSGGEQQRTAVARAVVVEPNLILADEPTGSLDRLTASEVFNLLVGLRSKKRSIIFATHNRELAELADYKLILFDGKVRVE